MLKNWVLSSHLHLLLLANLCHSYLLIRTPPDLNLPSMDLLRGLAAGHSLTKNGPFPQEQPVSSPGGGP